MRHKSWGCQSYSLVGLLAGCTTHKLIDHVSNKGERKKARNWRSLPQQPLVPLLEDLPWKQGPSLGPSQSHLLFPSSSTFDPRQIIKCKPLLKIKFHLEKSDRALKSPQRTFTSFTPTVAQSASSYIVKEQS